mgnify:CR=1 FL=1
MALGGAVSPAAGTIRIDGEAVLPGRFRQDVGLVFQNPDHQLICPTVREDVAFGPRNLSLAADVVTARVEEAMAETGVSDLADRAPHNLSGGEKRMCSIAAVLALAGSGYDDVQATIRSWADEHCLCRRLEIISDAAPVLAVRYAADGRRVVSGSADGTARVWDPPTEPPTRFTPGGWNLEANVTLQSAEDRTTGNPLLRRPERKGSVTLDYRFDSGSWLGMEWFHSGSRNDFGGVTLAGGRGRNSSPGALLVSKELKTQPLLAVTGPAALARCST